MIGIAKCQETLPPFVAAMLVKLKRHFERDFDGGTARIGIKHPRKSGRRDGDKSLGQFDRRRMTEPKQRRVRDVPKLSRDRGINLRLPMPVHVGPQR